MTTPPACDDLHDALLSMKTRAEIDAFLADLCTPAELRAFSERWQVARLLDAGGTAEQIREWGIRKFNAVVNVVVTSFFLTAVAVIFLGCLREWVRMLSGKKTAVLREDPYVALEGA